MTSIGALVGAGLSTMSGSTPLGGQITPLDPESRSLSGARPVVASREFVGAALSVEQSGFADGAAGVETGARAPSRAWPRHLDPPPSLPRARGRGSCPPPSQAARLIDDNAHKRPFQLRCSTPRSPARVGRRGLFLEPPPAAGRLSPPQQRRSKPTGRRQTASADYLMRPSTRSLLQRSTTARPQLYCHRPYDSKPLRHPTESGYRRRTAISVFGSFTLKRQVASAMAASTSVASTMPIHFLTGVERTTYMSHSEFEETVRTRDEGRSAIRRV
jgi:hypothetical protein